MDVDPIPGSSSGISTAVVLQAMPKIDEDHLLSNKPPKERIVEMLDMLETHVEKLRRGASQLEEDRDALLSTLDSVVNADLMYNLDESESAIVERDDVTRYADRIISRCMTVEVRVMTQRDKMQEEALFQVNHLIDSLVITLRSDPETAKQRCVSYMNACSSQNVQGITDKNFESALLGCTMDDQKKVKRRLQGLLNYFEKMKVVHLPPDLP
ncbi:unnamed protein product [Callosobruchus maculatus]|uniref:BAG domain-containing protein n=1 Tax=Callosobruchus maculatus TaxID=64391 RepID=A0A653C8R4_CALMS|nr:unnamed protein product [Callosobruchus maculatus]